MWLKEKLGMTDVAGTVLLVGGAALAAFSDDAGGVDLELAFVRERFTDPLCMVYIVMCAVAIATMLLGAPCRRFWLKALFCRGQDSPMRMTSSPSESRKDLRKSSEEDLDLGTQAGQLDHLAIGSEFDDGRGALARCLLAFGNPSLFVRPVR